MVTSDAAGYGSAMPENLPDIPQGLPPWLRQLHQADQLLHVPIDPENPPLEPISIEQVGTMLGEEAETVYWVWKDWPRKHFVRTVDEQSNAGRLIAAGTVSDVDEGNHMEIFSGGLSGFPSVVFPSGHPELFLEAQPFQAQELVGRMHEFTDNYIDRIPPLDSFKVMAERD